MPDQYGNPTMNDWLLMSRGISAMNADNRVKKFENAKDEMVEQFGSIKGVVENADPAKMNQYQLKAYQGFSSDYKSAMDTRRSREVDVAKANIMAGIKQSGGDPFAYFNTHTPSTESELKATAEIRGLYSKDSGFQKQMFENRMALANAKWGEAQTVLGQAEASLAKGDQITAGRLIEGMTRNVPMRGHYELDEKTGLLHRMYLSREQGWVDTGETMSPQEFLQFAKGFTQQEFAAQVATQMEATSQFNREQILGGGQEAVGPNGEKLSVYAQIDPTKFDGVNYIVHQNGKNVGTYTAEQLQQHGVRLRNMEQEKAQADLDAKKAGIVHTQQQTATSRAAMEAHEADRDSTRATLPMKMAKAKADLEKALQSVEDGQMDAGREALADFLMPFTQKGAGVSDLAMALQDPEAYLSKPGVTNALQTAADYIRKAESGEKVDPAMLDSAKGAVTMFNKLSAAHKGKYNLEPTGDERAAIDEIKKLAKQFGPAEARRIWEERQRSKTTPDDPRNRRHSAMNPAQ